MTATSTPKPAPKPPSRPIAPKPTPESKKNWKGWTKPTIR